MLEIDAIFKQDSIVKILSEGAKGDNLFQEDDKYMIFEKGGKHLLTLVPKEQLDSTSSIKSIEFFDARFKTSTPRLLKILKLVLFFIFSEKISSKLPLFGLGYISNDKFSLITFTETAHCFSNKYAFPISLQLSKMDVISSKH